METNLLIAISSLVKNPITNLVSHYRSVNRINGMGDALEFYVKDLFCNSLAETDLGNKNEIYSKYFSYVGNQNNPPDLMIKKGDAIEIKKVEGLTATLALNSSYPKDKLYSDSPMITAECRSCEEWTEKDLIYVVGTVSQSTLKNLWFVYGDCYAANKEIYERIRNKISSGVNEISDLEFSTTNELGRVNKVDPLGITDLRIRGMWGIKNPTKVFDYVVVPSTATNFLFNAVILKSKYLLFPKKDVEYIESLVSENFLIKDIKIKSPNNPANLLDAKLLSFKKTS